MTTGAAQSEPSTPEAAVRGAWTFGAALLSLAVFAWWFARGEGGVRLSPGDPGPWFVPRVMATLVGACGAWELLVAWRSARRSATTVDTSARFTLGDWLTLLGIVAYVGLIPIAGFTLASCLAGPLFMYRQGLSWRWWWTVLLTVGFVLFVKWLFGSVFGVMISEGFVGELWTR